MKILIKKLKKTHFAKKFFYFLSVILYIVSVVFMTSEALIFKGTEPVLLSIVLAFFIIWGLIYILSGLTSMISKKNKTFIVQEKIKFQENISYNIQVKQSHF